MNIGGEEDEQWWIGRRTVVRKKMSSGGEEDEQWWRKG